MNNYTLDDIEKYINELAKRKTKLIELKEKLLNIPLVGFTLYKKAVRVETEIEILREDLVMAKKGSLEQQQAYIKKLSPVLSKLKK